MSEGALELQRELETEVRDLELRMARHEGQLDEKRSLLARLVQATGGSQMLPVPAQPRRPPIPAESGDVRWSPTHHLGLWASTNTR